MAGVGAAAADDDLGLFAGGDVFDLVVVEGLGVLPDLVAADAVELAGEVELVAVGEVAAVGEIEAEDGVAGGEQGHEGGGVGLRAGVGLDVGVLGAEELFGAVAGEGFDDVGELATAVVAFSGVALGVFVGKDGAGGLEHGARDEVLGGDHLETFVLAENFVLDLFGDLRIGGGEGRVELDGHGLILCCGASRCGCA